MAGVFAGLDGVAAAVGGTEGARRTGGSGQWVGPLSPPETRRKHRPDIALLQRIVDGLVAHGDTAWWDFSRLMSDEKALPWPLIAVARHSLSRLRHPRAVNTYSVQAVTGCELLTIC